MVFLAQALSSDITDLLREEEKSKTSLYCASRFALSKVVKVCPALLMTLPILDGSSAVLCNIEKFQKLNQSLFYQTG